METRDLHACEKGKTHTKQTAQETPTCELQIKYYVKTLYVAKELIYCDAKQRQKGVAAKRQIYKQDPRFILS